MRRLIRWLAGIFYKPLLVKWLSKERYYAYHGISLVILPEIFHPGFFFSTKILLRYLSALSLYRKTLLELGAGSGLISITAAKAGAVVTATDINPVAMAQLHKTAGLNKVDLTILTSDLFTEIPEQFFDMIVINPPYYFESPVSLIEYAWYCGRNGEYFEGLFKNLSNYIHQNTVILIILCEDSKRPVIQSIANRFGFAFECIRTESNLIERNYIYQVHKTPGLQKQDEKNTLI